MEENLVALILGVSVRTSSNAYGSEKNIECESCRVPGKSNTIVFFSIMPILLYLLMAIAAARKQLPNRKVLLLELAISQCNLLLSR
jgi:hypothetical protein